MNYMKGHLLQIISCQTYTMTSFFGRKTLKMADKEIMNDRSDGIILVMGVTGAGKSYFINQLKSESAVEGHSLYSGTISPLFAPKTFQINELFRDTEMPGRSDLPR